MRRLTDREKRIIELNVESETLVLEGYEFHNKSQYLNWREEWKDAYGHLSRLIRGYRAIRKEYDWKYVPYEVGNRRGVKKVKIGENVSYDPEANWRAKTLSKFANRMNLILAEGRRKSYMQKIAEQGNSPTLH